MAETIKTNAARILDSRSISYELIAYEVDESDLSAGAVAAKLGQDVDQVFKTLVLRGDKTGIFVCIVPGSAELDLKKAGYTHRNRHPCCIVRVPFCDSAIDGLFAAVWQHRFGNYIGYRDVFLAENRLVFT